MRKAGQISSDMIVWRDGIGQMAARIEGEGARRQTVTVSPATGSTAACDHGRLRAGSRIAADAGQRSRHHREDGAVTQAAPVAFVPLH